MTLVRAWKKVYEGDLESIIIELKDLIDKPSCLILSGDVGSGKTTFTKKFVESFQTGYPISMDATSPSYSIINENGPIAHADFYRIENEEELVHLEIPLYIEGKEFFIVEWGIPYFRQLKRELGEEYKFYEIKISTNELRSLDSGVPTRNFLLSKLA